MTASFKRRLLWILWSLIPWAALAASPDPGPVNASELRLKARGVATVTTLTRPLLDSLITSAGHGQTAYVSTTGYPTRVTTANLNATSSTLGTVTSGIWHGSTIDNAYLTSSTYWNTAYTNITGGAYAPTFTRVRATTGVNATSLTLGLGSGVGKLLTLNASGTAELVTDIPTSVTHGSAYVYRSGGRAVPIADGGTGRALKAEAFDALSPTTTLGDMIVRGANSNARLAVGAAGTYLAGGTSPAYATLNQAAVAGLTTTDDVMHGQITARKAAGDSFSTVQSFSSNTAHVPGFIIQKSHSSTPGTLLQTVNGDVIGYLLFYGANSSNAAMYGARIRVNQNGTAGTRVPTNMYLSTYSDSAENEQLFLHSGGNVAVGASTSPPVKLTVVGTVQGTTGFSTGGDGNTAGTVRIDGSGNATLETVTASGEILCPVMSAKKAESDSISVGPYLSVRNLNGSMYQVIQLSAAGNLDFWGKYSGTWYKSATLTNTTFNVLGAIQTAGTTRIDASGNATVVNLTASGVVKFTAPPPTSDPHVAGQVYTSSGVLMLSAG